MKPEDMWFFKINNITVGQGTIDANTMYVTAEVQVNVPIEYVTFTFTLPPPKLLRMIRWED